MIPIQNLSHAGFDAVQDQQTNPGPERTPSRLPLCLLSRQPNAFVTIPVRPNFVHFAAHTIKILSGNLIDINIEHIAHTLCNTCFIFLTAILTGLTSYTNMRPDIPNRLKFVVSKF